MMAQPKLSKKELKEDEFLNTFERVLRYVSLHSKVFTYAMAGLLLVIIAICGIRIYFERYEAKASQQIYSANAAYKANLALVSQDSAMERRGTPDFQEPLSLYQEFMKQFPRSRRVGEALYQSAQCLYHLSKYDEAISSFQKYLQRYPKGSFSVLAGLGLGNCLEEKSEFEKAATAYSNVIRNAPGDPLLGEAYVSLARCQEATGKKEEANNTYKELIEKFPNSSWKSYAERKLLYLKSH
jgi:TolA-binding protein